MSTGAAGSLENELGHCPDKQVARPATASNQAPVEGFTPTLVDENHNRYFKI